MEKRGIIIIFLVSLIILSSQVISKEASTDNLKKFLNANEDEKKAIWNEFVESTKDLQNTAWKGLTYEEQKKILIEKAKDSKANLRDIVGLNIGSLEWEGSKLKTKSGGYLDFDNMPPWTKEIEFQENRLILKVDTQFSGDKNKERIIILEGDSSIDKNGRFRMVGVSEKKDEDPYTNAIPEINFMWGESGIIRVDKGGKIYLNEDSNGKGAYAKIGKNFYKQFYSKNNYYEEYKPEDGGDESAVIGIVLTGDSPSTHRFIPELKNTIVQTPEGEFYTSRRDFVKFFYKSENFYLNPIDFSKEEPFIRVVDNNNNRVSLMMKGDAYMGLVANPGIEINELYAKGKGTVVNGHGQYIYFRNGGFGTAVKEGETYVSGNPGKAAVSVNKFVNELDLNPVNELTIVKKNQGFIASTYDGRVVIDSKIWKEDYRLSHIERKIDEVKSQVVEKKPEISRQIINPISYLKEDWTKAS